MFKRLSSYRLALIPNLDLLREMKRSYRSHAIDLEHELNDEGVSDVRDHGLKGANYYYQSDSPPYYASIPNSIEGLLLRNSVIEKCVAVNQSLNEINLELYFFDCYRPIEVQNYFHDVWFPGYLQEQYPELKGEELMQEVEKYWARGAGSSAEIDPLSPPPHSTGGAFDLTIRKENGEHLYMGSIFDDVTEVAHTDYFERLEGIRRLNFSEKEAQQNRRLLYGVMEKAGFQNNPNEWWHFSYGDQMWARLKGEQAAFYSFVG